jgi:hypothetical protein
MTPLRLSLCAATMAACTATAWAAAPPGAGDDKGDRSKEPERAMQGSRVGADQTPGWNMMTPQERQQLQQELQAAKTPEECRQVMDKQRRTMAERAKERNVPAPTEPRRDVCAPM